VDDALIVCLVFWVVSGLILESDRLGRFIVGCTNCEVCDECLV
jgi:hypothetical protein